MISLFTLDVNLKKGHFVQQPFSQIKIISSHASKGVMKYSLLTHCQ